MAPDPLHFFQHLIWTRIVPTIFLAAIAAIAVQVLGDAIKSWLTRKSGHGGSGGGGGLFTDDGRQNSRRSPLSEIRRSDGAQEGGEGGQCGDGILGVQFVPDLSRDAEFLRFSWDVFLLSTCM